MPGAGPNYDPRQPRYLRMNYAARHVDMWLPGESVVPASEQRSFTEWSGIPAGAYVPRGEVGLYLADGLARVLRHAPRSASVEIHRTRVCGVTPIGSRWRVAGRDYDQVVIATGHQPGRVYPVDRWLSPERIPPGSRVAVRGFALTFIDVALALTEGRGGEFTAQGEHPYRLTYDGSRDDGIVLLPYSRSGRPMLPKPSVEFDGLDPIMSAGRERVRSLPDGSMTPVLAETAAEALIAVSGNTRRVERDPAGEIAHSLSVGAGLSPPDTQWAVGHTWRSLYPAIVERFGGDGLTAAEWPAFRRLEAEMERVAFGPGPQNAAKLLALIEAGVVDVSQLAGPARAADVHVDAVMPPPGATGRLLEQLVAAGHLTVPAGRRGISGCAPGLSVVGRPTEDWVIGNDTLSRTLHAHARVPA